MPDIFSRLPARSLVLALALPLLNPFAQASDTPQKPGMPTDPHAIKTFQSAVDWLKVRQYESAISSFRKAAKQDGHCTECLSRAYTYATQIGNYKEAEDVAREWLTMAATDADRAEVHYRLAVALQRQGIDDKKEHCFTESCDEFKAALQAYPNFELVHYSMGISLAHLHQDDAAKSEFSRFLQRDTAYMNMHERAQRYLDRVELARARMTPPFGITTIDGKHLSLDSLAGKVVLIDFWATWCGPCRQALPHLEKLAHQFQEEPFVIISISLDKEEAKWKEFVAKNEMTWPQYRDGSFDGAIAKAFGIHAIPATFTIDADGVLEDQHVGDADIDKKLKKLIAAAREKTHKPSEPVLHADRAADAPPAQVQ